MARDTSLWHTYQAEEVERELKVQGDQGLSEEDVLERQDRYGKNIIEKRRSFGFFGIIGKQFKSPLVLILLAAGSATLFLQAYLDTLVIFIALFINVAVGTLQEERAGKAFEKLSDSQEKFATVIREGRKKIVAVSSLVPGDIIFLEGGGYVPADIRLTESKNLSINESTLTGEWIAVHKEWQVICEESLPLAERSNMAFMGTLVSSGYGKGIVVETAAQTQMGIIAQGLGVGSGRATPLQQSIRHIARFLLYIILGAVFIIFILGLFRGETLVQMLLVAIAVAVASMPEGLPAAVTIVLALGMESLLKQGGLVRNLLAAETLGSTTIVLTDKTGTLTEANMKVSGLFSLEGIEERADEPTGDNHELLRASILAGNAFIEQRGDNEKDGGDILIHGEPMEKAIVSFGIDEGVMRETLLKEAPRIDFLQFESARRFSASLHEEKGSTQRKLYISGAPELLIEKATRVYYKNHRKLLTPNERKRLLQKQNELSRKGARLIAYAEKYTGIDTLPEEREVEGLLREITFVGLIAFTDPVRKDVVHSIQTVKDALVRVVMVTGDNPQTAKQVALEVGIAREGERIVSGEEINHMSDEELYDALMETPVFARVLPEQKLHIARVLKDRGEVVAMTGDGVNDAPALESADIGVAVGSGTEVAKASADIVLLNNSFSIITSAIKEGRRIIDNLKKIVSYLLSTSFSEIFVIGSALAVGAPLPLLPGQILWANIVEEGFMSFAFAFEGAEKNVMKRDPRDNVARHILTSSIKKLIILVSLVTTVFLVALYFILHQLNMPLEEIRTFMFVALSIDSIFFAFSFKSLHTPVWKVSFLDNRYLLGALLISLTLLVGAVTLPPIQKLLSLVPLSPLEGVVLLCIGIFNLFVIEFAKYLVFERKERG